MLFPIRTDRKLDSTPWVNITLIVVNVLIFIFTRRGYGQETAAEYVLNPLTPALRQFLGYQFLHADGMHLFGNMIFLYVFGNSVEDRLGKIGYLAFYLAGGVVAGLGHVTMEDAPVLGASGSVAAVTGAYLALFPLSNVTIFYFWFFIGTFEISSLLAILFQIISNVVFEVVGSEGVAYLAHLAGYAYGFAIGMGLLATRLLPREPYDLLALLEQRRRRSQFRSLTRQGYQPWEAGKPGEPPALGKPVTTPQEQRIMDLRSQIAHALASRRPEQAAGLYGQLLELDPAQVMSRQQQVDLANQLMAMERYEPAAKAYELFLSTYRGDSQKDEVELMLALLYTRYLNRRQRAKELVAALIPRLHDQERKTMAQQMLAELSA